MVAGVFDLSDSRVSQLMTPLSEVIWLDIHDNPQEIRRKMTESGLSRFPVARKSLANILGMVEAKDLLIQALAGGADELKRLFATAVARARKHAGIEGFGSIQTIRHRYNRDKRWSELLEIFE